MLETVKLLTLVGPTSFVLIIASFFAGFSFIFGARTLDTMYIRLLLQIFEYARSTLHKHFKKHESENGAAHIIDKETNSCSSCDQTLIERQIELTKDGIKFSPEYLQSLKEEPLEILDMTYFVKCGIEAILDDDVTKRFTSEELEAWNLLSRTNKTYHHINMKLTIVWFVGFLIRYCVLLPMRLIVAVSAITMLVLLSLIISVFPIDRLRRMMNSYITVFCFRFFMRAFSGVLNFHNRENKAKPGGICVANHTSPIDVIILGCDNNYAMIGQKHEGFFGWMQGLLEHSSSHIWFERSETRDRLAVGRRMGDHVSCGRKEPLLVFPEGTCVNNTSVMLFKKGSFDVGSTIYPVAIKYDPRFADCFWDSSKYGLIRYLLMTMTSWAIVADVWYLPPEKQRPDEDAIQFANRVKSMIARQGGLVDLQWDGALKRQKPKPALKEVQQASYSRFIRTGQSTI